MRVGIIGNYGHDNNGDEAILSGILTQLNTLGIRKGEIVIFSNNPSNTESRYNIKAVPLLHKKGNFILSVLHTVKQSFKIMKDLDLLIIGGGGLLMDMYKRDAPLYSTLGLLGYYAKCRIVIYGVGAGPITTKAGKFFIKTLANKADSISVRDVKSKELLKAIGIRKEIDIIGDPAFAIEPVQKRSKTNELKKVAVTAVPYFSKQYWPQRDDNKYEAYVKGMARNLDELIEKTGATITFFSTKYPQDVEVTREIYDMMTYKQSVRLKDENLHPDEIVKLCAEQDLIIGTRLHSLILSVVASTPVLGVGYHHKVEHFLQALGKQEHFVEIGALQEKDTFLQKVQAMTSQWDETQCAYEDLSETFAQRAAKGLEKLARK
ncbi:polysaccharide pyruvyl transferase family protein [Priestia filamentosa]|uniref:Polysaccharide pyruvyl transferase n=1 Tax=Priestia filamentosa TaxID=1402861 RepID=A0A0H4KQV6_9BACI|nr:polysaccharide pyruvyl transferase family protein [Priestia filamentosa]AKO94734.1 polysaccharide pyruvyl transferase [Priestia filamentosa]MDT3765051.1 polysaccharide pyruvyl transferase family protein [Priestia filamentosa]OXS66760.1 polysaccharide pyruvyl transferase [Priestia filamentosa]RJS66156.1 polysaccharide pyruvyl transferase [Priestia filamentosa]WCM15638.1 polysaccharide pyruvyl transferase family protein [Priestia filamentosa]